MGGRAAQKRPPPYIPRHPTADRHGGGACRDHERGGGETRRPRPPAHAGAHTREHKHTRWCGKEAVVHGGQVQGSGVIGRASRATLSAGGTVPTVIGLQADSVQWAVHLAPPVSTRNSDDLRRQLSEFICLRNSVVCELSRTRVSPWSQEPGVLTRGARHQLWPGSGHTGSQQPPPACPTPHLHPGLPPAGVLSVVLPALALGMRLFP